MTESLVWEDYLTVGLYFAVVLAVGLWVTCLSRGITDNDTNSLDNFPYQANFIFMYTLSKFYPVKLCLFLQAELV